MTTTTQPVLDVYFDELQQDVRYGLRLLRRRPGVAAIVIATLAIAIGGNVAIFGAIRSVLLRPLPYSHSDRVVRLGEIRPATPSYSGAISAPNYLDWTRENTVFDEMAAETGGEVTLDRGTAPPIYVAGRIVSPSYFDVFGLRAALGRTFTSDEGQPGRSRVVVLSHRLWRSQFAADPAIVNKPIILDGEPYTVIGVMPAGIGVDLLDPELWRPSDLGLFGGALTLDGQPRRERRDLNLAVARLKQGISIDQAERQMVQIAGRLAHTYPLSNAGWGISVRLWPRPIAQDFAQSLYLLLTAVIMLLLIGCVNIANLAMGRGFARAREIAIRSALGAGRGRLVRQLVVENVVLAIIGGLIGIGVAHALVSLMTAVLQSTGPMKVVPSETEISIDGAVWVFGLMLSLMCGIASSIVPALMATRTRLESAMKEGTVRGQTSGRHSRKIRRGLVVAEVAIALVLLTAAGVLIRSFYRFENQSRAGFDASGVLTARLPIASGRFPDADALNNYLHQIMMQVQSVPGVRDVAFAEGLPTQGTPYLRGFQVTGQPQVERARRPIAALNTVTPSYFRALGLQILKGRALAEGDLMGAPLAVVINDTFAKTYLRPAEPIGERLVMSVTSRGTSNVSNDGLYYVVGVVADEGLSPWTRAREPMMYVTRAQNPSDYVLLIVRSTLDPARLQHSVSQAVSEFDHTQALSDIKPLDDLTREFVAADRYRSMLLNMFATIALALAATGLYGVVSHVVMQRQREMGIRVALGASVGHTIVLVVRDGMSMTMLGVVLGLAGAISAQQVFAATVVGVERFDPQTMIVAAGLLSLVALIACYIPARRAARVDPCVTLKAE